MPPSNLATMLATNIKTPSLSAVAHQQNQHDVLLLYKPYGCLSQFTQEPGSRWSCLADLIKLPGVYPAGRLDADSEGLLLLTSNGKLQQRLTDPRFGHWRSYWVQVEGTPNQHQLQQLRDGISIQGRKTLPAHVRWLKGDAIPALPERDPPIRFRKTIPTHWLEVSLREGRNRQVRRMTAAIGLPTLRLLRCRIDLMDGDPPLSLDGLKPGEWRPVNPSEHKRLMQLLNHQGISSNRRRSRGAGRPGSRHRT